MADNLDAFLYGDDDQLSDLDAFLYDEEPAEAASTDDSWQITKGLKSGFDQTQAMFYGLKAAAGDLVGNEDWVESGLEGYQRNMEEARENQGRVAEFTAIEGVGDFVDWGLHTLGQLVPTAATSLAGGGAGGLLARKAATEIAKKAAAKAAAKKVDDLVAQGVTRSRAEAMAARVGQEVERRILNGATGLGSAGGAYAAGGGMETGNAMGQIYEETGEVRGDVALAHGAVAGAIDALPITRVLNRIGLGDTFRATMSKSLPREIVTQALMEGGTEGLQALIEQHAVHWVKTDGESLLGAPEHIDWKAMLNEAAAGMLGGAVMSAASAPFAADPVAADPYDPLAELREAEQAVQTRDQEYRKTQKDYFQRMREGGGAEVAAEYEERLDTLRKNAQLARDNLAQLKRGENGERINPSLYNVTDLIKQRRQGQPDAADYRPYQAAESAEPAPAAATAPVRPYRTVAEIMAEQRQQQAEARAQREKAYPTRSGGLATGQLLSEAPSNPEAEAYFAQAADARRYQDLKRTPAHQLNSLEKRWLQAYEQAQQQPGPELELADADYRARDADTQARHTQTLAELSAARQSTQSGKGRLAQGHTLGEQPAGMTPEAQDYFARLDADRRYQELKAKQPFEQSLLERKWIERYERSQQRDVDLILPGQPNSRRDEQTQARRQQSLQKALEERPLVLRRNNGEPFPSERVASLFRRQHGYGDYEIAKTEGGFELHSPDKLAQDKADKVEALRVQQQAAARKRLAQKPNPQQDELLTAIAKLGGIRRDTLDGVDPADYNKRVGIQPLFPKNGGLTFDQMATELSQGGLGWVDDAYDLMAKLDDSLRGGENYTSEGAIHKAERDLEEHLLDMAEQEQADTEAVFDLLEVDEHLPEVSPQEAALASYFVAVEPHGVTIEELQAILDKHEGDPYKVSLDLSLLVLEKQNEAENREGAGRHSAPEEARQDGREAQDPLTLSGQPATDEELDQLDQELGGEGFALDSYTEDDLAAQEQARQEREQAEARQRQAQERKAQADAEVDDFRLAGSDRPADVAASRGQNDMFGAGSRRSNTDQTPVKETAKSPASKPWEAEQITFEDMLALAPPGFFDAPRKTQVLQRARQFQRVYMPDTDLQAPTSRADFLAALQRAQDEGWTPPEGSGEAGSPDYGVFHARQPLFDGQPAESKLHALLERYGLTDRLEVRTANQEALLYAKGASKPLTSAELTRMIRQVVQGDADSRPATPKRQAATVDQSTLPLIRRSVLDMTLDEFAQTPEAKQLPKGSALRIKKVTPGVLRDLTGEQLSVLADVFGIARSGSKAALTKRLMTFQRAVDKLEKAGMPQDPQAAAAWLQKQYTAAELLALQKQLRIAKQGAKGPGGNKAEQAGSIVNAIQAIEKNRFDLVEKANYRETAKALIERKVPISVPVAEELARQFQTPSFYAPKDLAQAKADGAEFIYPPSHPQFKKPDADPRKVLSTRELTVAGRRLTIEEVEVPGRVPIKSLRVTGDLDPEWVAQVNADEQAASGEKFPVLFGKEGNWVVPDQARLERLERFASSQKSAAGPRIVEGPAPRPKDLQERVHYLSTGEKGAQHTLRMQYLDRIYVQGQPQVVTRDYHLRNLGIDYDTAKQRAVNYLDGQDVAIYAKPFDLNPYERTGEGGSKPAAMSEEEKAARATQEAEERAARERDEAAEFARQDAQIDKNEWLIKALRRGQGGFVSDMVAKLSDGDAPTEEYFSKGQLRAMREVYGKIMGGRKNSAKYHEALTDYDAKMADMDVDTRELQARGVGLDEFARHHGIEPGALNQAQHELIREAYDAAGGRVWRNEIDDKLQNAVSAKASLAVDGDTDLLGDREVEQVGQEAQEAGTGSHGLPLLDSTRMTQDEELQVLRQHMERIYGAEQLAAFERELGVEGDLETYAPSLRAAYESELIQWTLTGKGWGALGEPKLSNPEAEAEYDEGTLDVERLRDLFAPGDEMLDYRKGALAETLRTLVKSNLVYHRAHQESTLLNDLYDRRYEMDPESATGDIILDPEQDAELKAELDRAYEKSLDMLMAGEQPMVALHFDTVTVYGIVGESISYLHGMSGTKRKTAWGDLRSITPLPAHVRTDNERLTYIVHDNNSIKQRQITRNELKVMLGKRGPGLQNRVIQGTPPAMKKGLLAPSGRQGWIQSGKVFLADLADAERLGHKVGQLEASDAELIITKTRMSPPAYFNAVKNGDWEGIKARVEPGGSRNSKLANRFKLKDADIRELSEAEKQAQIDEARQEWADYKARNGLDVEQTTLFVEEAKSQYAADAVEQGDKQFTAAQRVAISDFLDNHPEGQAIRERLQEHAATPWAKQAQHGILVRLALDDLLAGRRPSVDSFLGAPSVAEWRHVIETEGAEGIWSRLDDNGMLGQPDKPGFALNGSFLDCKPSKDCATYCYAAKGRNFPVNVVKAEMTAWAMRNDPERSARMIAEHWKQTPEGRTGKKALRLFDKGDAGPGMVAVVRSLNAQGIRTHVFSKHPEFLRQIGDENLRLLSVDASNLAMAERNPDLPVALVYGPEIPTAFLEKHAERIQVILPVKQGARLLGKAELARIPKQLKPVVCPVDKGVAIPPGAKKGAAKTLRSQLAAGRLSADEFAAKQGELAKLTSWTCFDCDKKGGVGCYYNTPTDQVERVGSKTLKEIISSLEELKNVASSGRLSEGGAKELREELARLLRQAQSHAERDGQGGAQASAQGSAQAYEGQRIPLRDVTGLSAAGNPVDGSASGVRESDQVAEETLDLFDPANLPRQAATRQPESAVTDARVRIQQVPVGTLQSGIDRVSSPADAAHIIAPIRKHAQETMLAVVLDGQGKVLNLIRHTKGVKDASNVSPSELAGAIVNTPGAKAVYFGHNHPSGNLTPSRSDLVITEQLRTVLDGTGVSLKGHVIVGAGQAQATFFNGDMDTATQTRIRPAARKRTIALTERVVRKLTMRDAPAITSPDAAGRVARQLDAPNGLVLLNTKNQLIGTLPLSVEDMAQVKRGQDGAAATILRALDSTNASAVIIKTEAKQSARDAARNLAKFINATGVRLLDHLTMADGEVLSSDAQGSSSTIEARGAYYRLGARQGGLTQAAAQRVADTLSQELGVSVRVASTWQALPTNLQADLRRDQAQDRAGGLFDPETGTAYLIASNLASTEEAARAVLHEVVGHKGLRALLGRRLDVTLTGVYRDLPAAERQRLERRYASQLQNLDSAQRRQVVAEEYLAQLAESEPKNGRVQSVVAQLRNWLRRVFPRLTWREADLVELVAASRRKLRQGGGPGGGGGSRFMFAGQQARNAGSGARQAQALVAQGKTPEQARQATGWHQGGDGQWRFEISDDQARLKPMRGKSATLGEVLEHPQLFEAYPDLRELAVVIDPTLSAAGQYSPTTDTLTLRAPNLSIVLHEVQHAIQTREGFAAGGSLDTQRNDMDPAPLEAMNALLWAVGRLGAYTDNYRPSRFQTEDADEVIEGYLYDPAVQARLDDTLTQEEVRGLAEIGYDFDTDSAWWYVTEVLADAARHEVEARTVLSGAQRYHRLAGEVEARNTEARAKLTPAQRRAQAPSSTQDVPDHQQVIERGVDREAEAWEWEDATRKGLDMSSGARAQRALAQGFVYDLNTLIKEKAHEQGVPGRLEGIQNNPRPKRGAGAAATPQRLYHGTADDIGGFDLGHRNQHDAGWLGRGVYLTDRPELANSYANIKAGDADPNVLPVYARIENPFIASLEVKRRLQHATPEQIQAFTDKLISQGHDSAILPFKDVKEIVVFDPARIRSVHAAFDTEQSSSINLLYSLRPDPAETTEVPAHIREIEDRTVAMAEVDKPIWQRIKEWLRAHIDTNLVTIKQGVLDSFASIEALEKGRFGAVRDASESAYKAALRTKNLDSMMGAVMQKGTLVYQDGGVELKEGSRGFLEIFEPIAQRDLVRTWETWAAAKRAKRLLAEGKERNFTQDDVTEVLAWVDSQPEIKALFEEAHRGWQRFNRDMLDFAESAGLINPEERALWERDDYIPFHRVSELGEENEQTATHRKRGLSGQKSGIRKLEGGIEKIQPLEAMVRNTAALIDASMKNIAMQRVVELADGVAMEAITSQPIPLEEVARRLQQAGIDTEGMSERDLAAWRGPLERQDRKDGTVSVSINGRQQRYLVNDPVLMRAITSMGPNRVEGVMKLFRFSKRLLTTAVTSDPSFAIRNLIRDSLSTWVTVQPKTTPLVDAMRGVRKSLKNDDTQWAMMAAGAGGGGFYDTSPEDARAHLTRLERHSGGEAVLHSLAEKWKAYQKVLAAGENANRIAVYDSVIKSGGTRAEAAHQAQDVLNFTKSGDYAAVRMLIEMVPFMNARLQGLERLYRGAKEDPRAFALKGSLLMGATLALLAANWDNDDYWELPEHERDTYYHFWIDGTHYRLPKPFEVGAIFSTIPERAFEQMRADATSKELAGSMLSMVANTFAMNPTPQLVKPMVEIATNENSFTGSPIVSQGMKFVRPEAQYNPYTSETMRAVAEAMPGWMPDWARSPVRLEHAFRGYLGTLGGYALLSSDWMVHQLAGMPTEPAARWRDVPVVKSFVRDGVGGTKYSNRVYDMLTEANELYGAVKKYREEGEGGKAQRLAEQGAKKLAARRALNRAARQLSEISSQMKRLHDHRDMSAQEKRRRLDLLVERRNEIARQIAERYWGVF